MTGLIAGSIEAGFLLVLLLIPAFRRKKLVRAAVRASERSGLALTPAMLPVLIRRRRATWIGYALGSAIGFEATVLLQAGTHLLRGGIGGSFGFQGSWFFVGGLGALLGGVLGARSVRLEGPRVARGRAVTVADYVEPAERSLPWFTAAIAMVASLVPVLHGSGAVGLAPGAAAVATVGVSALVARWIVSRPQRADSTVSLAWDDALRSGAVRNLFSGAVAIALVTLIVSVPTALTSFGLTARSTDLQLWASMGVCAVLLVLAILSERARPARYFLRRLWPGTAAQLAEHERPMEVQR